MAASAPFCCNFAILSAIDTDLRLSELPGEGDKAGGGTFDSASLRAFIAAILSATERRLGLGLSSPLSKGSTLFLGGGGLFFCCSEAALFAFMAAIFSATDIVFGTTSPTLESSVVGVLILVAGVVLTAVDFVAAASLFCCSVALFAFMAAIFSATDSCLGGFSSTLPLSVVDASVLTFKLVVELSRGVLDTAVVDALESSVVVIDALTV